MVKRSVIQIAGSTQLISLPRRWAVQHGINKGDELEIEEHGSKLVISTDKQTESGPVEIDITDLDRTSIIFLIRGLYKKGYDELRLHFRKPLCQHYRLEATTKVITAIHTEVNRLTGMDIVQQKESLCVLKAISQPSDKELDSMLRRVFILLNDAAKDLIEGAKVNDRVLIETINEKHDTLTKFISYTLRILNKIRNEDVNTHFLYHVIAQLDKITDVLKICSRDLLRYDKKLHKESIELLDIIYESFGTYYELFYKFDLETVRRISEKKELVNRMLDKVSVRLPPEEVLILSNMHHSLELFKDLTEAKIAMAF